jgi:integrase
MQVMEELTISQFVDKYLLETKHFLKSHSSVASVLKTFVVFCSDRPLLSLSPVCIHGYTQARLLSGIKSSTINHELSVISAAVTHAGRRWGIPIENPVRFQWLRASPLRLRYLERHEAVSLIYQARLLRVDVADFIQLALNTGCRKTELLTLRWSDIDLDRRYLVLRPENTKSGKRRAIPLNENALVALRCRLEGNETEWVFANRFGKRVKALDWLFRKAVKSAGIDDFRIHDLRHTFASWLVSEGVELIKVRDLLGHSSIKMTERYAHLMPNRLQEAVCVLDGFIQFV